MASIMWYLLLLIIFISPLNALSLKDKFTKAHSGDYVVFEQGKNISLLFIRCIDERTLVLEEITAPSEQVSTKDWKNWVAQRAQGHTSWVTYEIDLPTDQLLDVYSFSEKSWLNLSASDTFLPKLSSLPLEPVPLAERRRIGPAPHPGEADMRALWAPPLIAEGEKRSKPTYEVFKTIWPKDHSFLSNIQFELYFDTSRPLFPFPCWIECKSAHFTLKMRTLDSGTDLRSFFPHLPHRIPVKE